jgi:hypothetical protein
MEEETKTAAADPTYTREALAVSKKYADRRDTIMVVLNDSKQYTTAEADQAIEKYLKKPVKEKINGKE